MAAGPGAGLAETAQPSSNPHDHYIGVQVRQRTAMYAHLHWWRAGLICMGCVLHWAWIQKCLDPQLTKPQLSHALSSYQCSDCSVLLSAKRRTNALLGIACLHSPCVAAPMRRLAHLPAVPLIRPPAPQVTVNGQRGVVDSCDTAAGEAVVLHGAAGAHGVLATDSSASRQVVPVSALQLVEPQARDMVRVIKTHERCLAGTLGQLIAVDEDDFVINALPGADIFIVPKGTVAKLNRAPADAGA